MEMLIEGIAWIAGALYDADDRPGARTMTVCLAAIAIAALLIIHWRVS